MQAKITQNPNFGNQVINTPLRFCSRCEKTRPLEHFKECSDHKISKDGRKIWCEFCERTWQTHKIIPTKQYNLMEIVRLIGGSLDTLRRMKEDGRLIVISTRRNCIQGQRLIEAIQNRRCMI